jgi:hypothetical protein
MAHVAEEADVSGFEQIPLARVLGAQRRGALPIPMVQESQLPFRNLAPEVFEWVVAEFAWLGEGLRNVSFYGRRGQKQYGLDIVGTARDGKVVVYQVKRFQTIAIEQIRTIVEEYAGAPTGRPPKLPARRFNADRFVLVISVPIEVDTTLTDEIHDLRLAYAALGLEVEVFGAEHLSRSMRDSSGLIHAVFGPEWTRAFCGVDAAPNGSGAPSPFGLLEDPLEELNLVEAASRARQLADDEPRQAAELLSSVASELARAGYMGHGNVLEREAGTILEAGGHSAEAFDVIWRIGVPGFLRTSMVPYELRTWRGRLVDDPVRSARATLLQCLADWYACAYDVSAIVTSLDALTGASDPDYASLTCVALEQAVADGLFTQDPPVSWVGNPMGDDAAEIVARLLKHGQRATEMVKDRMWRCRLRCAVADAVLDIQRRGGSVEVMAAYETILSDAGAGRLPDTAAALAHARAAHAYAAVGDIKAAEDQWRRSFMNSIRAGYGGDARNALVSLEQAVLMVGIPDPAHLSTILAGVPNRRHFFEAGQDGGEFSRS